MSHKDSKFCEECKTSFFRKGSTKECWNKRKFCSMVCYSISKSKVKTRRCCLCKEIKNIEQFTNDDKLPAGKSYKCIPCNRGSCGVYYAANKDRLLARSTERNRLKREKCLKYYGGDPPKCKCCGEARVEFLAIDHKNNDGAAHRKELTGSGGGHQIYSWIIKNNFPEKFQVLCHNCNMSKGFYGYCPHEKERPINLR